MIYRPLKTYNKEKHSFFALTILVSNTFTITTLIIYWKLLKDITKYPWTLKGRTTVDLPLTLIATRKMSTFPCQNTPANTSNVLSDLPPKIHVIQPTNRQYQHIAKALSMKKYQTKTQLLIKKSPKTYKPRSGHYCTTHGQFFRQRYWFIWYICLPRQTHS